MENHSQKGHSNKFIKSIGILNLVSDVYQRRGPYYIITKGPRFALGTCVNYFFCWYYKKFHSGYFQFRGKKYPYYYNPAGQTWRTERSIEIPIIWNVVNNGYIQGKRILEVGNVLSYRFKVNHDIVDKYEKKRGIINEDIVNYNPKQKYDIIVSISTMEHVGWDEEPHDPPKVLLALKNLRNILAHDGQIIITLPVGQNSYLDNHIKANDPLFDKQYYFKRVSNRIWEECNLKDIINIKYDFDTPSANAIVIGVNGISAS